MYAQLGFIDDYASEHISELLREVERDRLADQALGRSRGRSLRRRLASGLYLLADRLENRDGYVLADEPATV